MYLEIPCPLVKTDRFVHVNLLLGTGNRFQHKSFRYKLKQWNCTKISFTSSIVCWWTRKTFWVNTSSFFKYVELFTPIETNGNPWESTLIGNLLLFICPRFLRRCRGRSSSLSSVTTQNNSWYATISLKNRRFDGKARRKRRPQVPRERLIKSTANKCTCWQGAGWEMNENEVEEIPETGSRQPIGHIRVPPEPLYQNEVKC